MKRLVANVHHSGLFLNTVKRLFVKHNECPSMVREYLKYLPRRIRTMHFSHLRSVLRHLHHKENDIQVLAVFQAVTKRLNILLQCRDLNIVEQRHFICAVQHLYHRNETSSVQHLNAMTDDFIDKYEASIDKKVIIYLRFLQEMAKHKVIMGSLQKTDFVLLANNPRVRLYDINFITSLLHKNRSYVSLGMWDNWLREFVALDVVNAPTKLLDSLNYFPGEIWCSTEHRKIINQMFLDILSHPLRKVQLQKLIHFFITHIQHGLSEKSSRDVIRQFARVLTSKVHDLNAQDLSALSYALYKLDKQHESLVNELSLITARSVEIHLQKFSIHQVTRIAFMFARINVKIHKITEKIFTEIIPSNEGSIELRDLNFALFSLLANYSSKEMQTYAKKYIQFSFHNKIDRGEAVADRANFFRHALVLFTRMKFCIPSVLEYATTIMDEILENVKPDFILDILAALKLLRSSGGTHAKAFNAFRECYPKLNLTKFKLLTAILSTPSASQGAEISFVSMMIRDLTRAKGKWRRAHHILSVMRKVNELRIDMPYEMNVLWGDYEALFYQDLKQASDANAGECFRGFVATLEALHFAHGTLSQLSLETAIHAVFIGREVHVSSTCAGSLLRLICAYISDPLSCSSSTSICRLILTHVGTLSARDLAAALHCVTRLFSIGDVTRRETCEEIMDALCEKFKENMSVTLAHNIIADFSVIPMQIRSVLLHKLLICIGSQTNITSEAPAIDFVQYLVSLRVESRNELILSQYVEMLLVQTLRSLFSLEKVSESACERVAFYLNPLCKVFRKITQYVEVLHRRANRVAEL